MSQRSASIEKSIDKSWFNFMEMNDNTLKEFEANTKSIQKSLTKRHLSLKISAEKGDESVSPNRSNLSL